MNCVIYARVSTEQQAERELSIPAQLKAMREYATRQGWTVVEEFLEPGVSGRTAQRPILQAMLKRCRERPKIDVVVVHKIDRLVRSVYGHAMIRYQLQQHAVKLASVVENVDDSVSGQLVENIMASIAEFYSANLGEEVKKGMRMLVERGGWPHLPARGYRLVRDVDGKGRIEIDDGEAANIRWAFERYATGFHSLHDLRQLLADRGFRAASGRPIPLEAVRRMLTNPFYAGRVRWNGVEHAGNHAAVVPEDLFRRVQATLTRRHRDTGEKGRLHFLMRGVACCGECGAKMTAERHGRWSYYRCVKNTSTGRLCSAAFSNVSTSHAGLLELYSRLRLRPEGRRCLEDATEELIADRVASRRARLTALRVRQTKLEAREIKLSETYASGDMSLKAYRAALGSVRNQIAAVDNAVADVDADPKTLRNRVAAVLDVAMSLRDLHGQLGEQRQSHLLRIVFKRILLERGEIAGYELNPPFNDLLSEHSGGTGDLRSDFEDRHVTPTIRTILELDTSTISMLLGPRAA